MGIPRRMAVALSGLAFAGTAVLGMGAAAPTAAAAPPGTQAVRPLTLSSSWCARHPWRCHGFRHHHRHHHFRHHGHHGWGGWGGWGGHGGWGVSIHNDNFNFSSSGGHGW
jgi:hypothetical protein